jgi:integrase
MAGKRRRDKHLPPRVYLKGDTYYYVETIGATRKWIRLADNYAEMLIALGKREIVTDPDAIDTIAKLATLYEREEFGALAPKTRAGRRQQFKKLLKVFGHMAPEEVTPADVFKHWKTRGRTVQARHEVRGLSVLMTYARQIGARNQSNPCFQLQLPQPKHRTRYVTDEEFFAVRDLAPPMIKYAMDLAVIAGMDQSTIRRLERKHLTDEGLMFERGKTGAFQLIEWNDDLRATVERIKRLSPQVRQVLIANRRGRAYTLDGFQSQWQRVMRKAREAGLALFHFHDLRAKSASDSESDQQAADRLGHGDVKLTREVYRRLPRRAPALAMLEKRPHVRSAPAKGVRK